LWQSRGYIGQGNVNGLLGSLEGRAVVILGGGEAVFKEFREVRLKVDNPVVFAVNDVGMYINPLDHWISIHNASFPGWLSVRRRQGLAMPNTHSVEYGDGVNYAWLLIQPIVFILSGYFAMQMAYLMGAERIILCGIPGEPGRRFFDVEPREFGYGNGTTEADKESKELLLKEMKRLPEFKRKIRSMSGFTREVFGALNL